MSPWKGGPGTSDAAWNLNIRKQLRAACWLAQGLPSPAVTETISLPETLLDRGATGT